MKIVLDAGHIPGKDPGSCANGLKEVDLTTRIVDTMTEELNRYQVNVLVAPRGEPAERAVFANKEKADFFLSVHINAGGGTGYESYIHPFASSKTKGITTEVHGRIGRFYSEAGFANRGLKQKNFAVLRETTMPAMLVENLFIDDPEDATYLRQHAGEIGKMLAMALAEVFDLSLQSPVDPCKECGKVITLKCDIARLQGIIEGIKEMLNK